MAESKIRDDNFFMVSGWMLNRLGLKGTALHVFAIIYGFSQDGEGSFTGSLQYLMDFTNTTSKHTVLKALKDLVEFGYIEKLESSINGVKFCTYKTAPLVQILHRGSAENALGVVQKMHRGSAENAPNNKDINKSNNISISNIQEVVDLYHSICVSYPSVKVISDARKKTVTAMLEKYSMDDFRTVFENAEGSSFLKGSDGGWKASFDWLMKEGNFIKVLEGNYADKRKRKEPVPGWMEHSLGDAELEAIQKALRDDVPTIGNDADLADRAEKLRQRLSGE